MTVHDGAQVAAEAVLGEGTTVWPLAQIREGARLGAHCIVGRAAYVGADVPIGDNCMLRNLALVYEPAVLGDGALVGRATVLAHNRRLWADAPHGVLEHASPRSLAASTDSQEEALDLRGVRRAGDARAAGRGRVGDLAEPSLGPRTEGAGVLHPRGVVRMAGAAEASVVGRAWESTHLGE